MSDAKNQELIRYTTQLLLVSPLFQILESIRISLFGVLRALKDIHFTLLTSIISFWCVSLPIGYLFATGLHMSATGFWWGMVLGATSSIFLLIWRDRVKMFQACS